jgi:hypothetical protein
MKTRFVVILCVLNAAVLAAGYLFFSDYWGGQVQQDRESYAVQCLLSIIASSKVK